MLLPQLPRLPLDRLIAVRPRPLHAHRLAVQLEPAHLLDGAQHGLLAIEHDKRLALALERALGDDVQHGAVVVEHARERLLQGIDFHALLEVGYL